MNDPQEETREELIDDQKQEVVRSHDEAGQPLTTKDVATGVAAKRAREDSGVTTDSQGIEPREDSGVQPSEPQPQIGSPLFDNSETEKFRSHWSAIQSQFVDEPRKSVERADELVAATMKRLAEIFSDEREKLEREWDRGEDISTEDLRIALQRYRSFFDRLLSV